MRQCKTELSIIFILLFIWEAEFFILDIWPNLKSDTQTVFAQDDTSPGLGQTTPSTNSEPLKVVINEIAWMGTVGNRYGEWIELYNTGTEEIDLNNWKLYKDGGGVLIFTLTKKITSKGYLVIERTTNLSPDPLPEINDEFGKFGGGSLINLPGGEHLVLKNAEGDTVEDLNFSSGWPAGNNTTDKQTMERKSPLLPGDDSLNWQTSQNPGGTPKAENSKEEELNLPPEEPSVPPENPEDTPDPIMPNVIINELFPNPKGKEDKEEFIELNYTPTLSVELS